MLLGIRVVGTRGEEKVVEMMGMFTGLGWVVYYAGRTTYTYHSQSIKFTSFPKKH